MANNQYINKVIYGNTTLLDLTSDTATADKVLKGYTFHDKTGASVTGTAQGRSADIVVTYSSAFYNKTITCTKGSTTYTQTTTSSGSTTFSVSDAGEWTITCNGVTIKVDVIFDFPAQFVPNGKTVTPTDNIQKWLNCAGIFDKTSYTTLANVLADSTTLLALISDNNAVDYLVRSTTWASGVMADSTAMTDIGANNYCANTLLADSTWCTAICNSTYFESVLNVKVPTMTSNTAPSGVCSASSVYNSNNMYDAYHAFDGSTSSLWHANATGNAWIRYKFANSVKCYMAIYNTDHSSRLTSFKAQGSSDGSTFADVTESLTPSASNKVIFTKNVDTYQYYQLSLASSAQPTAKTVQFYGR